MARAQPWVPGLSGHCRPQGHNPCAVSGLLHAGWFVGALFPLRVPFAYSELVDTLAPTPPAFSLCLAVWACCVCAWAIPFCWTLPVAADAKLPSAGLCAWPLSLLHPTLGQLWL